MNFYLTIKLLVLFIISVKSLDFIYLFQTKEYRIDRMRALFEDEELIKIFLLRLPRLPAKSARNILIIFQICLFLLIYYVFTPNLIINSLILLVFFSPAAFTLTTIGILTTGILANIKRRRLINLAQTKIKNSKTIFIGITGSYGKTTSKEFLYQILSVKFRVAKTSQNQNSDVGVAISILKNLKIDTEIFIVEMGAYRRGEIKAICDFIHPTYGILTAIGNQHQALFGSRKNLIKAKQELFLSLPNYGKAYLNSGFPEYKKFIAPLRCKIYCFVGTKDHFSLNLIPCVALASDLGIPKSSIDATIQKLKPFSRRLSQQKGFARATILNDSYNSNVEGFIAAVKMARLFKQKKKIIISRGIIELGNDKVASYKRILNELNGSSLKFLTTDKLFQTLSNRVLYFSSERELFDEVKSKMNENTLLVVEGKFNPDYLKTIL